MTRALYQLRTPHWWVGGWTKASVLGEERTWLGPSGLAQIQSSFGDWDPSLLIPLTEGIFFPSRRGRALPRAAFVMQSLNPQPLIRPGRPHK